ncbi:MAG: NADH-quinone oxidoreductase subunit L [Planctomycetota bacterium]
MFEPDTLIWLIPALPLFAAILTAVLGPKILREQSHLPAILGIGLSCVLSIVLLLNVRNSTPEPGELGIERVVTLWTWADIGADATGPESTPFRIDVSLRSDPLTAIMLSMVTFIATLVAIYGVGYMHGDRGYWRFFAYVSLFVFSMVMLVSVSNFLLVFVFWEAVGACSYLLIGFWYEKDSAAAAGKKAFLVNRVGDFGFVIALFLIWITYGSWNFHDIDGTLGVLGQQRLADPNAYVGGGLGLAICGFLMLGACGKSAQFPLHVWLADAMEGPTPVSALIHAATMVTAGVYMVTRCTPLFMASPEAQLLVACIGGGTAVMAGLIAMTQFDLKRVLAYSTVSQLGYMFLGLGVGTWAGISAGMFHLFTHAFFKALLFLGAGSVMHAMGNVIDMRRFGGLRRIMPITHWTFAVGCFALAGIAPLSGFWSKDTILGSLHDQAAAMKTAAASADPSSQAMMADDHVRLVSEVPHGGGHDHGHGDGHGGDGHGVSTAHLSHLSPTFLGRAGTTYQVLYYLAMLTALLTSTYTFRDFYLTFYGEEEVPAEAGDHAHESPPSMWLPLAILAGFALMIGWVMHTTQAFDDFLKFTPSLSTPAVVATPGPGVFHLDVALTSTAVAFLGLGLASFLYLGGTSEANALSRLFSSAWLGAPYRLARGKFYWDEIYAACIVKPLEWFAALSYFLDRYLVDGLVNLMGWIPKAFGASVRGLHMGFVPFYSLAMVVGLLTLLFARVLWGG